MGVGESLLFAGIILIVSIIEGVVGFGGNILALPFISTFATMQTAVPVLALVIVGNAITRVVVNFKQICWPELLKMVGISVLGIPFGMAFLSHIPEAPLKIALGILMMIAAGKGFYEHKKAIPKDLPEKVQAPWKRYLALIFLFLGGLIQGAFACGGPFLAIYAKMFIKEKDAFRVTLFAAAMVTAGLVSLENLRRGAFTPEVVNLTLYVIPAIAIAYFISTWIQKRIDGQQFVQWVNGVLLLGGIFVLLQVVF